MGTPQNKLIENRIFIEYIKDSNVFLSKYVVAVGCPDSNIRTVKNTLEDALIYIGRVMEKFKNDEKYKGRDIYVTEIFNEDGDGKYYITEKSFSNNYLIGE